jgi:hypothetical protein
MRAFRSPVFLTVAALVTLALSASSATGGAAREGNNHFLGHL